MGILFEAAAYGEDPVAVKVVTTELTQDEIFLRRLRREVAAAQKIAHANVVPVLANGDEGGLPYLVQRLIPGGSLADRIAAEGTLGLQTTLKLLSGAAAGIDALHAGGLVHRDIKPANILLDGDTAYVSDFGLAKDSQASNLTRPRPGAGLAGLHRARADPRRGRQPGDRHLRPRLHVRRVPDRQTAVRRPPKHARAVAHLQDPPPDLTEVRRDLSPDVARAVARAMEKEAVDRPTSAAGYVASVARASGS